MIRLLPVNSEDLPQFKKDMQTAFQTGAWEGGYPVEEEILPEEDINRSLGAEGAAAYKATLDGQLAGGAIVVVNGEKGHLDFLYVKNGNQGRGIGKFIWFEIEKLYPQVKVWETATPYFEKRNIHFYVNVCGFHITRFYNSHYPDPDFPQENDEMFGFTKELF